MADPIPTAPQSTKEIFCCALDRATAEERAAYLDGACGKDLALRQRVAALLSRHFAADPFMNQPAVEPSPGISSVELSAEGPGTQIGRYKLLEKIGEGGFGVVYVAEQREPVKRRVAFKVIKLGMDTRQVVARFEAERQALALMDHPNIAKVHDGGATETGRPYFVMELVRGIPITQYCEQEQLDTRTRLDLFIKVCHSIQHAHQKGIIHRDIKPSNILVTLHDGVPVPKVIDFGIAKATQQDLTEKTLYTHFHQFIGTPAYMSPEQAVMSGLDIDTRSDIYSLGVLLYELLTGQTPFDTKTLLASGLDEMRRTIREVQPVRPSTLLRKTGASSSPGSSAPPRPWPVATDLDWIVMKCLEKDRTRRYETANGLAMDLQRHLDNEPVLARPPSRLYEFRKSVQRHKVGFAATTAVILALMAGVLVSSQQANRARKAETQAVAAQAQAVDAQENEAKQRLQAEAQELAARQRAYAADMVLADQYLDRDNLRNALELINRQRPEPGQKDLRDWEWRYLWQRTRSDALFTLGREFGKINALVLSADTNWLAVGRAHLGGLSVWDLRTRQEIRLAENEERIWATFSPTEPLLAFTGLTLPAFGPQESILHLWDAATHKITKTIPLTSECAGLAFSKDGRTLVTSTAATRAAEGCISLWRVPEGTAIVRYPTKQSIFELEVGFAASPDLGRAAYTYYPPTDDRQWIRVVDLRDGSELCTFPAAKHSVTSLAFSPDGTVLASARGIGEQRSIINLWDAATGRQMEPGRLTGHNQHVLYMLFWPDGSKLASASGDQTTRIWDVASGKCLDVMRGQAEPVRRLVLSPDSRTLITGGSKEGTVCFWDTSNTHSRPIYSTLPATVLAWRFTADSRSVHTLDTEGMVVQWSGPRFHQRETLLEIGRKLSGPRILFRFSQDGHFLAIGSYDGALQVWDVAQRRLLHQINTTGFVAPLEFPADGDTLYSWSQNENMLYKWDLVTGQAIRRFPVPPWPRRRSAYSPDGQLTVMTDEAGNVWRLNLVNGNMSKLDPPVLEGGGASFSPDGRLLAISSIMGVVRVWNTETWTVQATNLYGLFSTAFSPDNKRLATGGGGAQAITLWDTESWKKVLTLEGQFDGFGNAAFSPDGNVIGSPNQEGILHLWRAPSWEEIEAAEKVPAATASAR